MVKKISNKKIGIISNTVNLSKNFEETSLAIEAKRALAESVKIWHETIKKQEEEAKEARLIGEKMKNAFDELYSNILKQMNFHFYLEKKTHFPFNFYVFVRFSPQRRNLSLSTSCPKSSIEDFSKIFHAHSK